VIHSSIRKREAIMNSGKLISGFVLMLVCGALSLAGLTAQPQAEQMITGPYAHENLAVFLIHGKDRIPGKHFLTLAEALKQKKAVVYETSQVNDLVAENSSDEEVFIQS
jgi:hypothetical protein